MGYWRASKRWCKQMPSETVNKALAIFANNEAGLRPADVYAGSSGAIAQLQQLAAWFQVGAMPLNCYQLDSGFVREQSVQMENRNPLCIAALSEALKLHAEPLCHEGFWH